jgi:hypothetical protein
MEQFKVGDIIEIIRGGGGTHPDDIGKTTTVLAVGESYCYDTESPAIRYNTKGLVVDSLTHNGTYVAKTSMFKKVKDAVQLDITKPLETIEGTPVKLIATQSTDPKWPLLVLEGNAVMPTKYNLKGEAKNGVERRFLKNAEPKPSEKKKSSAFYVNVYPNRALGEFRYGSRAEADEAYEEAKRSHGNNTEKRIGVVRVQPGHFDD